MSGDERKQLLRRAPEAVEVGAEARGVGQLLLRRQVMWALEDKGVLGASREAERQQGQGEAPADSGEAAEESAGVEHEGQRSTRPIHIYASNDTQSLRITFKASKSFSSPYSYIARSRCSHLSSPESC